ncbi:MAG: YdcF family protein [Bacteroidia bacterium]|nr:YdcF family protein [Bacteroidia bacterium]
MGFWKRVLWWLFLLIVSFSLPVIIANIWVIKSTEDKVYTNYHQLPENEVGLVLGTSNKLTDGSPNPFFENRIKTAAALYHEKKVSHFILSGDNRSKYYNEPFEMKKALMKLGVPESAITLDYAGLRTLDSVVRSKEIFGQDRITIITQPFHCYRAIFISNYYNINAVAVALESGEEEVFNIYFREYLARTKAILDLYVLKTAPRHLGDKEPLDI